MYKEIIISTHPFEKRIAIKEDDKLVEYIVVRENQQYLIGNIYKGVVKNVVPGLGVAFIDIGLKRTAFIHYKDLNNNIRYNRNINNNEPKNIQNYLKVGQEIVVQIKKAPIGDKGARVVGKISIPGKFLVFLPESNKIALSKKIVSRKDRKKIREILYSIKDDNSGLIVRTEALDKNKEDYIFEYESLKKINKLIKQNILDTVAPAPIFDQNDFANVLIRDIFREDTNRLVVDNLKMKDKIISKIKHISPNLVNVIEHYKRQTPIFNAFGIESEINRIFEHKVMLPSGGNLIIEHTEAMVVIDINSGRFTGKRNYENTIKKVNIEAAKEVARQIRLRNLSGIIAIDFINMENLESQEQVLSILRSKLKNDRSKINIYPFSPLGVVQISRKMIRKSSLLTSTKKCPLCQGVGIFSTEDSFAMKLNREIKRREYFLDGEPINLFVHPSVKIFLDNHKDLFYNIKNRVKIFGDEYMARDKFKIFNAKTKKEIKD